MSVIFDPVKLGNITLTNRFVRAATWEGMADEQGHSTPKLAKFMKKLAEGRVGLIITGHAYVSPEGQAHHHQLAVYHDKFISKLTEMAGAVHEAHGKIFLQIAHAGFRADRRLTGLEPIGPSAIMEDGPDPISRAMTEEEIEKMCSVFGDAALRAQKAGFDGVQIHGGHGYLISQFLAPLFNWRSDGYAGSLRNRSRMLLETIHNIRAKVGGEFPVILKINSEDFFEQGFTLSEMLELSQLLDQECKVDAIEISGGNSYRGIGRYAPVRSGKMSPSEEAWYRDSAIQFKSRISIPLMLVGGIRSLEIATNLIEEGFADYISMSRPFICEPALVRRWESGDERPALCKSDTLCFKKLLDGDDLKCHVCPAV
ncbi:MAG: NADH:flavin oxidoreductase [Deltaproteobacteria bacterium]|nr:NADH:flavin oxidoreductase [Deltaproteobacteria bacterium]